MSGPDRSSVVGLILLVSWLGLQAPGVHAADVTFSGMVSYLGPYSGDALYVAVLDTTGEEDVTILALETHSVGSPPLTESFALSFDNTGAGEWLILVALLDVDGGGVDSVSGADVVGWYPGVPTPVGIASAQSQSGLDFALPRAEIQGMITFAPGQAIARVAMVENVCLGADFGRPPFDLTASGPYHIVGVYAGTWCVSAEGYGPALPFTRVCHGDPTCANPTLITLTAAQVRTGVDLDFSTVPTEGTTWGRIKARYR